MPSEDAQPPSGTPPPFRPYVSPDAAPRELTLLPVLLGAVLGIVFGASSVYLVLKVGLTVSASIPVAVLSITILKWGSRLFGTSRATILQNNIVQTTGSAGESIAFGVGVTMPALLILGFEMSLGRVMLVSCLGGLLGILMMIPLRRAFIVQQHGKLPYPEGTACAQVLIAGEKGGTSAVTVFLGFGVAFVYKLISVAMKVFAEGVAMPLRALKGAVLASDVAPELLGVGYIIGPRIASIMVAGGVLAYIVLLPAIVFFASSQTEALFPGTKLIRDMSLGEVRNAYILYIGAGAVAAGGILSMFKVMPMIARSGLSGFQDLKNRAGWNGGAANGAGAQVVPRTERDLPMRFVILGSLALVLVIWGAPPLHMNLVGALLIVLCGFLFVTVSSRLTGEIGSSSNPISGMTVATLLITCLVFLLLGWTTPVDRLTALSIAAIVCIAASNGGTTSQDLKTGFLVGGTPRSMQIAILIGALSSAIAMGGVLKVLNDVGTVYSARGLPTVKVDISGLTESETVAGPNAPSDPTVYHVWRPGMGNAEGVEPGKYLVDDAGGIRYLVDPAINGRLKAHDNGALALKFDAPKTQLMALIIDGVLTQKLPWGLVLLGVFIAITLELSGVPSLPFAVGVYLPLAASMPIFLGGLVRWGVDRWRRLRLGVGETDSGAGVLLSSGLIAGGTIAGVTIAFLNFWPSALESMDLTGRLPEGWGERNFPASCAFLGLMAFLFLVGVRGKAVDAGESS